MAHTKIAIVAVAVLVLAIQASSKPLHAAKIVAHFPQPYPLKVNLLAEHKDFEVREGVNVERLRGGGGLKIALCSWESLHSVAVGGVAPHVTELAAGLCRRGHEVHLYTRAAEQGGSHDVVDGVHVHKVPIELDSDFVNECNNMCNAFTYFLRQTEEYMKSSFDIIHCHDWLAAKALVQLKQAGRKCILTM
jgi:glycogen synthase